MEETNTQTERLTIRESISGDKIDQFFYYMWFKLWLYVLKEILTSFFENIKIDPPPTWKFSKSDLPYKVKKKFLSDFNVFGVK